MEASAAISAENRGSALDTFTIEHMVSSDWGSVEVRDYSWTHITNDIWAPEDYFVDFPLTPRPQPAWARYQNGTRSYQAELGRVMFIPAGLTVSSGAGIGRQRSLSCILTRQAVDDLLPSRTIWDLAALAAEGCRDGTGTEWLLFGLYRELRNPSFASNVVIGSLVRALAVLLIRQFSIKGDELCLPRTGGLAPWRLRRIHERVRADVQPPDLKELAAICGLSVRQLTRAFRAETGQTITSFVQEVTIARARRMVFEGVPIGRIARILGFASSTSFSYAFRQAVGERPTTWRDAKRTLTQTVPYDGP